MNAADYHQTNADVIQGLGSLIYQALQSQALEEHYPGGDPDKMDDTIKRQKTLAAGLRKIREEFENLMTDVCGVTAQPVSQKKISFAVGTIESIYDTAVELFAKDTDEVATVFTDLSAPSRRRFFINAMIKLGL